MRTTEATIRLDCGITVTLRGPAETGKPELSIRKPASDQREGVQTVRCDLNEWMDVELAVLTLVGMMAKTEAPRD